MNHSEANDTHESNLRHIATMWAALSQPEREQFAQLSQSASAMMCDDDARLDVHVELLGLTDREAYFLIGAAITGLAEALQRNEVQQ